MSIEITLADVIFEIPTVGERGWGKEVTNWIIAANDILSQSSDSNNIPATQATLIPSSAVNLYEFTDPTNDRHVVIEYGIYRVTSTPTSKSETGVILLTYNPTTAAWELNNHSVGDASVAFSMSGANILQATATALGGSETTNLIQFKGRIIKV